MQTIFDLPMTQDIFLKLRRRHYVGIKTANEIARFRERVFLGRG
jgi:hypothetical protein